MADDPACCLECHFQWEERLALRFFPPQVYRGLLADHRHLLALKAQRRLTLAQIKAHAARERPYFARFTPKYLSELDRQHAVLT